MNCHIVSARFELFDANFDVVTFQLTGRTLVMAIVQRIVESLFVYLT